MIEKRAPIGAVEEMVGEHELFRELPLLEFAPVGVMAAAVGHHQRPDIGGRDEFVHRPAVDLLPLGVELVFGVRQGGVRGKIILQQERAVGQRFGKSRVAGRTRQGGERRALRIDLGGDPLRRQNAVGAREKPEDMIETAVFHENDDDVADPREGIGLLRPAGAGAQRQGDGSEPQKFHGAVSSQCLVERVTHDDEAAMTKPRPGGPDGAKWRRGLARLRISASRGRGRRSRAGARHSRGGGRRSRGRGRRSPVDDCRNRRGRPSRDGDGASASRDRRRPSGAARSRHCCTAAAARRAWARAGSAAPRPPPAARRRRTASARRESAKAAGATPAARTRAKTNRPAIDGLPDEPRLKYAGAGVNAG